MKPEELEGNILIGEFMEYELINNSAYLINDKIKNDNSIDACDIWKFEELQFHSSMDWIFDTIAKIESVGFHTSLMKLDKLDLHQLLIKNNYDTPYIFDYMNFDIQKMGISPSKKECAFKAIVVFVKWYNKNVKKK